MSSIALLLMTSTIYAVSIDCPNMIQFAYDLGMQTARPTIWSALQGDCCNYGATLVICDGSQRVTEIHWNNFGLNRVINGTAIPSRVTVLYLFNNAISGSIPSALPSGLVALYLYNNAISGSIPNTLSSGLVVLSLYGNQMSGDLPFFPSTLTHLW